MRNAVQIILGLMLLVLGHGTAWACKCGPPASCGMRRYSAADFIGRILSRQEVPASNDLGIDRALFKVRVIESFRGTQKVGEIVDVRTGTGGGDCGYAFKIGARYLIDASKGKNALFTAICYLTAPVQDAEADLRNLRRIVAGKRVPDLSGVLRRSIKTNSNDTVAPLPNIPVEAKRSKGGPPQKTVTDVHGFFTFEKLPKGEYIFILGLPGNLSVSYVQGNVFATGNIPQTTIEHYGAESAACHLRILVTASGDTSGVVQSSDGRPGDVE